MAFKAVPAQAAVPAAVEDLYDLLPKQPTAPASLWLHQGDLLRDWQRQYETTRDHDVALELPTGAGKTLVAAIIAEWLRRKEGTRVAYVCPNKLLARQVAKRLGEYGVDTALLIDKVSTWDRSARAKYSAGQAIGVTVYSHVFNSNPAISDADLLILDDAHAAEQYVSGPWTLAIDRQKNEPAYLDVLSAAADGLDPTITDRLRDRTESPHDRNVHLAAPLALHANRTSLEAAIKDAANSGKLTTDAKFAATTLATRLDRCMLYISARGILIRPLVPPTSAHSAFSGPARRIYMSATLGGAGELERAFGRRHVERIACPSGWEKRTSGRRLFVFPSIATDLSVDPAALAPWLKDTVTRFGRAAVLTPDFRTEADMLPNVTPDGYSTVRGSEVESDLTEFTSTPKSILALTNRYDGIDLPNEDCRLLIMAGLPGRGDLQERFLSESAGALEVLQERIRARTVQGAGRATRGLGDWAAVIVLDDDLVNYLNRAENVLTMREEMQAELKFGAENSFDNSLAEMSENLDHFRNHDADWKEAEQEILRVRGESTRTEPRCAAPLQASAQHEVKAWAAVWSGDYDTAVNSAKEVIDALGTDRSVQRYSSVWRYLLAVWLEILSEQQTAQQEELRAAARTQYRAARSAAWGSSWLPSAAIPGGVGDAQDLDLDDIDLAAAQQLCAVLGNPKLRANMPTQAAVHSNLKGTEATAFGTGLAQLGTLLGASKSREDNGDTAAPDASWLFGDQLWVGWEAKSEQKPGEIGADDVRQTCAHLRYIADAEGAEPPRGSFCVLVTPRDRPAPAAAAVAEPHAFRCALLVPDGLADRALRAWRNLSAQTGGSPSVDAVAKVLKAERCLPSQWAPTLMQVPIAAVP